MVSNRSKKEKTLLFGCPLKSSPHASSPNHYAFTPEESLEELGSLVVSAGGEVVGQFIQERAQYDSATLIGKGKVQELAGKIPTDKSRSSGLR